MEDFRTFIAVDYNFDINQTIAENQNLKHSNKVLKKIAVITVILFFGTTIYFLTEERKKNKYLL